MKFVLSIDGGGIRGIIPAIVLAEIEKRLGKPVSELFDLVAGTSTGGILALGLTLDNGEKRPKFKAEDLVKLYEEQGGQIFERSLWKGVSSVGGLADEKYSHKGLEKVLEDYFGQASFGAALSNVLITSYEIAARTPYFFKSWRKEWKSVEVRRIARATSAAPTYFEPALVSVGASMHTLVDGGVFINNPAMSAYVEAKRIFPEENEFRILSLGTGELVRPISYNDAKDWGKAGWLAPLLSCMFDGSSDAVDYQLQQLLGDKHVRLQTKLTYGSDDMDNATRGNIANLKKDAERLLKTNGQAIDAFVAGLQQAGAAG